MKRALNGLYNGTKNGFKITDLVFRKIDYWRNKGLFPLIRRYWPAVIKPNHLTAARFVVAFLIGWTIFIHFSVGNIPIGRFIIPLYIFGIFSDLIDGPVARSLNKTSRLGGFIDPVADKTLNGIMAIYLLVSGYPMLLMAILIPEIISAAGAVVCYMHKQPVESNIFGKTKMFVQSALFLWMLIFSVNNVVLALLWITASFAMISLVIKFWEFSTQREYGA